MTAIYIASLVSLAIVAVLLFLILFEPPLRYDAAAPPFNNGSPEFPRLLAALSNAPICGCRKCEVFTGGAAFYQAELDAIRSARRSIHVEAFLMQPSAIADKFVEALAERARAGVKVKLVIDAIGSFPTPNRYFDPLRKAGGRVYWYLPIRWYTLNRFNNRTHRELMVIDGRIGFIGGAGISAHWDTGDKRSPPWVDKVCRIEGELVTSLQTAFAENWLESSNEILTGDDSFPITISQHPAAEEPGSPIVPGFVVASSPTPGRSTRNRVLFQVLLTAAEKTLHINSPYFLPDHSATRALIAATARGVDVRIIVPGRHNNHAMTRLASRRRYGPLLKNKVRIFEYEPGMIHAKVMIVDGRWSVLGSSNFDSRSFDLNDEVNLAAVDQSLAARLAEDFQADLSHSREITFEQWQRRPLIERIFAQIGRVAERLE